MLSLNDVNVIIYIYVLYIFFVEDYLFFKRKECLI